MCLIYFCCLTGRGWVSGVRNQAAMRQRLHCMRLIVRAREISLGLDRSTARWGRLLDALGCIHEQLGLIPEATTAAAAAAAAAVLSTDDAAAGHPAADSSGCCHPPLQ
jgi:hypothetical protein